ncbi:MAG: PEP-CTERM sorting domain-containing protein [Phycisphaerae bacterium]|jgi:hypothetical protein|nr:PEP-CTERM sorting domain-containing protein [Phycisphaerae bacterium]
MKMRTLIIPAVLVALAVAPAAQAGMILAGFETGVADATIEAVGFTGTANESTGWFNTSSLAQADSDGTFGTLASASTAASSWKYRSGSLAGPFYVEFTLTNNTGSDYALEYFHFDAGYRDEGAAPNWSVDVRPGSDITVTNIAMGTHLPDAKPIYDYDDMDVPLAGLADSTLEAGGAVTIRVSFSGGSGNAGTAGPNNYLDNIAFTGTPEPATMVLMGFGGLTVLARRRRRA